jgi:hypothetical protein
LKRSSNEEEPGNRLEGTGERSQEPGARQKTPDLDSLKSETMMRSGRRKLEKRNSPHFRISIFEFQISIFPFPAGAKGGGSYLLEMKIHPIMSFRI